MSAEGSADLLAGLRQRQGGVRLHQTDRRGGRGSAALVPSSLTPNSAFQFDPMSLLSRPDLGSLGHGAQRRGWEERSHAQRQSGIEPDYRVEKHEAGRRVGTVIQRAAAKPRDADVSQARTAPR
jgi:hypothetical protein